MPDQPTPSDAARDAPKGRTREVAANTFYAEFGIDYTDGYRVTVGWSEEDGAWIARVAGCAHDGACLADGPTKEAALLNLACSMASLLDAVEDDRAKAVAETAATRADERARVREIVEGMIHPGPTSDAVTAGENLALVNVLDALAEP